MKKLTCLLLSLLILSSCRDKEEPETHWLGDPVPCDVIFQILDEEGHDLLDPANPDAFGENDVAVTCRNKHTGEIQTYYFGAYSEEKLHSLFQKGTYGLFLGAYVWKNEYDAYYKVTIGDFYQGKEIEDERIVLRWSDGTEDILHLYFKQSLSQKTGKTDVEQHIFLNDKEVELRNGVFTIVKKAHSYSSE